LIEFADQLYYGLAGVEMFDVIEIGHLQ